MCANANTIVATYMYICHSREVSLRGLESGFLLRSFHEYGLEGNSVYVAQYIWVYANAILTNLSTCRDKEEMTVIQQQKKNKWS